MEETLVINKNVALEQSEDYSFLRAQGLEYIQNLAGKIWTDYNTHDPGITLLEILCYAITDLGKRTSADMKDIVSGPDYSASPETHFYNAAEILSNAALTKNDLRKLFIDVKGVKNVFISTSAELKSADSTYGNLKEAYKINYQGSVLEHINPIAYTDPSLVVNYVNGLYNLIVELDEDILPRDSDADVLANEKSNKRFDAVNEVLILYFQNRTLCEDFNKIGFFLNDGGNSSGNDNPLIIPTYFESVFVKADIEITVDANAEDILAKIYLAIANYTSPTAEFKTLNELLDQGNKIEDIVEGPILMHGFLSDDDLENIKPKTVLYSSDIINVLMDIEGIVEIRSLSLSSNFNAAGNSYTFFPWKLELRNGQPLSTYYQPVFSVFVNGTNDATSIALSKGTIKVNVDKKAAYQKLLELKSVSGKNAARNDVYDFDVPAGEGQDFLNYYPVQNELPQVYGTAQNGLPSSTDTLSAIDLESRKAQSKQLKAYLLFYEQLLVNYLGQLNGVKDLLSWEDITENNKNTYYSQVLSSADIKDLDTLYSVSIPTIDELNALAESDSTYIDRKNRVLDHLMSRFNEELTNYSLLQFADNKGFDLAKDKVNFLQDYPLISRDRAKAYSYLVERQTWDTKNISGYQRRVARFMGIDDPKTRDVAHSLDILEDSGTYYFSVVVPTSDDHPIQGINNEFSIKGMPKPDEDTAGTDFDNFLILTSDLTAEYTKHLDGTRYYFKVVDTKNTPGNQDDVIIGQSQEFDTEEERDAAIELAKYHFSTFDGEGLHVIEHILLRPNLSSDSLLNVFIGPTKENTCAKDTDPYSFRLTVVFPAWPKKFRNPFFRKYAEDMMRAEVPAHIAIEVRWVTNAQLADFESCYRSYLAAQGKQLRQNGSVTCVVNHLNGFEDVYAARYDIKPAKNEDYFTMPQSHDTTPRNGYLLARVIDPSGQTIAARLQNSAISTSGSDPNINSYFTGQPFDFPVDYDVNTETTKADNPAEWIHFDPNNGDFTIKYADKVKAGSWQLDILVTDDVGFQTELRIKLLVIKDVEALYTVDSRHVNSYRNGDILLTFSDANDPNDPLNDIVAAQFIPPSPADPLKNLPPGTQLDTTNGNVVVTDYTLLAASITTTNKQYTPTIKTEDPTGGITTTNPIINIIPDTEAVYTISKAMNEYSYKKWDVLAFVEDADGINKTVDTAAQQNTTNKPLPPGTILIKNASDLATYRSQYAADPNADQSKIDTVMRVGSILVYDKTLFHYNTVNKGRWPLTILTTDRYTGTTINNFDIFILQDHPAVYTPNPFKSPQCYVGNEDLATAYDQDGGIVSAQFIETAQYPVPQNVIVLSNGTIRVKKLEILTLDTIQPAQSLSANSLGATQASNLRTVNAAPVSKQVAAPSDALATANAVQSLPAGAGTTTTTTTSTSTSKPFNGLPPKIYPVKVRTTDSTGGVTDTIVNLDLTVKYVTYTTNSPKPYTAYKINDVLAFPVSPDGHLGSITQTGGALPPGTKLNTTTGNIYISDINAFKTGMKNSFSQGTIQPLQQEEISQSPFQTAYTTDVPISGNQASAINLNTQKSSIDFTVLIRTVDDCTVVSNITEKIKINNDTPSVYSPVSTKSDVVTNANFPAATKIGVDKYTPGTTITRVMDVDNTDAQKNQFKRVVVVSGNFIDGAEINQVTGEIFVSTALTSSPATSTAATLPVSQSKNIQSL